MPAPALAALVAALIAVVVITALTYRALAERSDAASAVNHTNDVEDHLHRFLSGLKDAETGQRGFLLTGAERYLEPYQLAIGDITVELATLRRMTLDNVPQQRRLDMIAPLVDSKLAELQQTIDQRRAGDTAGALAVVQSDRGRVVMDRLRQNVDAMAAAEAALLAQRTDDWEASVQWS
ncbi:MAG TPA: CHASE3 domain-containing protein, partial [Kofleriaceae bacterium]|nr:CHASE3 domain-containing protein [Kofleriaceae bacterium]